MNSSSAENIEFVWTAHPARERPRACCAAAAILVGAAAAVYVSFGLLWAGFSLLVLVLALNRFFLRSRFLIDAQGIRAEYPLRRQRLLWHDVRRLVLDQHGGYLSRRARSSRLDAHTGMHVLFGRSRSAAVDQIRRHLGTAAIARATSSTEPAAPANSVRSVGNEELSLGAGRCRA